MLAGQSLNTDNELTLFIHDAVRFVSTFFIPISQCAPHVYISALPFAPEESLVSRKFCPRFPNTLAITQGKPSQWPMVEFTAEHHKDQVQCLVFSLDDSTFASISPQTMYVCDSKTGHCISGPFELRNYGEVYNACFSPDGKCILVEFYPYAVVWDIEVGEKQFRIEGHRFAFIHHDGRIASMHWVDGRILVKFWDSSNGALISDRLFEVNDVAVTQFSPDGRFLAVGRKSEDVIDLWNLEDGRDPRRFPYPPGKLSSLHFSPTSDTLMAIFREEHIYLWRLDTQGMVSFSRDFHYAPHVVHSPLTNYLFIQRNYRVEMWDVSMTGSKWIWETKSLANSIVTSICPSRDGHRLLVGYGSGSVRMWNVDLEDSARNRADTRDTQDGTATRRVWRISPSGKVAATTSYNVEFLDTNTWEVVACTDVKVEYGMEIAFSLDDNQAAILSKSLVTICDIMHPEERISFDPWPRKDVRFWNVTFQTCNDLVICAIFGDDSGLLQVWHRQDPPGFKCTCSSDLKVHRDSYPFLAPDGLTVVIVHYSSSPTCYSWNHDTAQFDPVHFDDQVHIPWDSYPACSPDGKLFACWSDKDSHVRVWDTRTRQLVFKFPTSQVYWIALSPSLIDHHLGDRLIALRFTHENAIGLFDAYNGHLYGQILGQEGARMAFIRDGTALAYYSGDIGLRTWEIADLTAEIASLTAEHQHPTDGLELMMQGMRDGWMIGQDDEPLFWVPIEHRKDVYAPPCSVMIKASQVPTILDFSNSRFGRKWTECIDKEWLRELEKKGKEVGNLLE